MMSNDLYGKRVVIVDDLLTSGSSLMEYAHNLERAGAKVEGAVFLARTISDAFAGKSKTPGMETPSISPDPEKV